MHNFVVHLNGSTCRKMCPLGLDQVNSSDAINVSSQDDIATVEHIFKLMKLHTEEKIGVESEAPKIFT